MINTSDLRYGDKCKIYFDDDSSIEAIFTVSGLFQDEDNRTYGSSVVRYEFRERVKFKHYYRIKAQIIRKIRGILLFSVKREFEKYCGEDTAEDIDFRIFVGDKSKIIQRIYNWYAWIGE